MLTDPRDYYWRIVYDDGTILDELNEDGTENLFDLEAVREGRIKEVAWVAVDGTRRDFVRSIGPGEKAILFRRVFSPMSVSRTFVAYAIGAEDRETHEKSITLIQPGCSVTVSNGDGTTVLRFAGCVEETTDPKDFVSALDKWVRSVPFHLTKKDGTP